MQTSFLCIHWVPLVFNGNTSEMLAHFTEEPLAPAEVWHLPVVVASDITAGEWGGGGGWPWRAPSGKISEHSSYSAAIVKLQYIHSTVRDSVGVN